MEGSWLKPSTRENLPIHRLGIPEFGRIEAIMTQLSIQYSIVEVAGMGGKPIPNPSILDGCQVVGIEGGRKIFKDPQTERYYTWDSLHGEVEVFNKKGRHLGVLCAITGELIKPAVKGRKISKQN